MFSERTYHSDQANESRIWELKQKYLEKQLQIESLERDREETLKLLNEAKKPKKSPPNDINLLEEARRRHKERNILSKPDLVTSKNIEKPKPFKIHQTDEDFPTTLYHEADDFKTFIDKEYQQLKIDLEALRNPSKKLKQVECSNNFTSISNLSDISTKNNEGPSISISFTSNPFKSPKNEYNSKPKSKIVSAKEALQERLTSFLNEKSNETPDLDKDGHIRAKFTIESNNIEIKPGFDKVRIKEIPVRGEVDRVQSVEKVAREERLHTVGFDLKDRKVCRSSSDRKRGNEKKRKDKHFGAGNWDRNFYPFPAYPFPQPFYPFHYPPYPSHFCQDPSTFYPSSNQENYLKTEISEKATFPFLFGNDEPRCFTQTDDISDKFEDFEEEKAKFLEETLKNEKNSEKSLKISEKSLKISEKSKNPLKSQESEAIKNSEILTKQENPLLNNEIRQETESIPVYHPEEYIPTFGDDSIDLSQDRDLSENRSDDFQSKKPVFFEIGETDSKPLSEIFIERKPKTAEKLQNREENLQKSTHKEKSKNELIEIRKNLLKGCNSDKKSKSPSQKRQKSSELTERLLSGQRAKITKEEMYYLNKKNYKALPEVQLRQAEEKKKLEKQTRMDKLKEFEKVRKS